MARTRQQLLERATFVAIRYGFAVHDAGEAEAKCAEQVARWRRVLEANGGNVEMTLKVAAAEPKPRPDRHDFDKGPDYLRALRYLLDSCSPDRGRWRRSLMITNNRRVILSREDGEGSPSDMPWSLRRRGIPRRLCGSE